jgi:hypothetical protein
LRERHEKVSRLDFFHLGRGIDPRTVQLIDSRHSPFVALPRFCEQPTALLQLIFRHRGGERGLPLGPLNRSDRSRALGRLGWAAGEGGGFVAYIFMGLVRPVTLMRSYFDFIAPHFAHDVCPSDKINVKNRTLPHLAGVRGKISLVHLKYGVTLRKILITCRNYSWI